ncbi:MAG: glycosyltransferase [Kyrpidia sp.]|nr:glycosyltransferase [Kyrpidia sp.]
MIPDVSVILPARNEQDHIEPTIRSIWAAKNRLSFELIVIDDGSADGTPEIVDRLAREATEHGADAGGTPTLTVLHTGGLGAAGARNAGAGKARGRVLIFCDAHVFVDDGWLDELVRLVDSGDWDAVCPGIAAHDEPDRAGFGQSLTDTVEIRWLPKPDRPTAVPIVPGACLAVPAGTFHRVGGFDSGLRTWGFEDVEWSVRMWLAGYRLGTTPHTVVRHVFRKIHPYTVPSHEFYYNLTRTALSHFTGPRLAHLLRMLSGHPMRFDLLTTALCDGTLERRQRLFSTRVQEDAWFVHRFELPLE